MTTSTTPVTISSILSSIETYATNPAAIQRGIMASLNAINNGTVSIVDATNPFVFCLEQSSVNAAAAMQQAAALTRRLYPAAATTINDLYLHMADTDYVDIFALPTTANFTLMINQQQLLNALVADPVTGIMQVIIPRNTVFYATTIPFSIQYPIIIRQLAHGGLQIVYDATEVSPLQILSTNVISYTILNDPTGVPYITFSVPTQQFDIVELINDVNSTGGFTTIVPFTAEFYYCRVYGSNPDGTWKELQVTYTEMVYDPAIPTAVISVANGQATVTIPVVYITTGLISGKVRIDVYETQGPMTQLLGNYVANDFTADFMFLDQNDASIFVAAFTSITGIATYSQDTTTGGRLALTFEQLQTRVINSAIGPRNIPITPSQIQTTLLDYGYTLVKNIDTITNRIYWATKALPAPTSPNLYTPANASVATIVTNIANGASLQGCTTHATGMTITSAALVQNVNGVSALMTKTAYSALAALSLPELCTTVNEGGYTYSPFYYVLDTTSDTFEVRPYYLDTPSIVNRSFIEENPVTGLQVSIAATYSIFKLNNGYQLTITTQSNSAYQALPDNEVFCQLCFNGSAQVNNAYMLGVQQPRLNNEGERTYVFTMLTEYDIDKNDQLAQTSFATAVPGYIPRSSLLQSVNVLFSTNTPGSSTVTPTAIDALLGQFQLPAGTIGVTNEILMLQFGYGLTTLWNSYRSIVAPIPYQTYAANVPATYTTDVYQIDPLTNASFSIVNGVLVYNIIHHAGDPILTAAGAPTYLHLAGDPIIDPSTNLPTLIANYSTIVNRSLDLVVIDGVYQFANDAITLNYVSQIDNALVTSLTNDLVTINNEALEQTEVYYYPSISKGSVNVIADNAQVVNIDAEQSFIVTLYITNEVYQDNKLISSLQDSTIQTLGNYLADNTTIAISQIEDALSAIYGADVLGVTVKGLGGAANYSIVTVTDNSTTLSINKILAVQPNNQIAVEENIQIDFVVHDPNM